MAPMPRQDRPSSSTYAADEMVAPNPPAARRRINAISLSVAVPSSCDELVVSGAITKRLAISSPHLNLRGDQTTIDEPPNMNTTATLNHPLRILQVRHRLGISDRCRNGGRRRDTSGRGHALPVNGSVVTSPAKVGLWDRPFAGRSPVASAAKRVPASLPVANCHSDPKASVSIAT